MIEEWSTFNDPEYENDDSYEYDWSDIWLANRASSNLPTRFMSPQTMTGQIMTRITTLERLSEDVLDPNLFPEVPTDPLVERMEDMASESNDPEWPPRAVTRSLESLDLAM